MLLREWREREGLTGDQAAVKLGLSQATISRIESGKHWPDSKTAEKIFSGTDGAVTKADIVLADDKSSEEAAA